MLTRILRWFESPFQVKITKITKFKILRSECVNSGLTSQQQEDHKVTGPQFKVSAEKLEKREIEFSNPENAKEGHAGMYTLLKK